MIRALLTDLRVINPTHPLLDKKVRDWIFAEFEQEDITKNIANRPDKKMPPRGASLASRFTFWKREGPEACQSE